MTMNRRTIAVIGGSGQEGGGLALRFAHAGHRVRIGSRDAAKAEEAARRLNDLGGDGRISGFDNSSAVGAADLVVLAVPYQGQQSTALALKDQLSGRILIDATVPLVPPKVARVQLPAGGSVVAALQVVLGSDIRVVSAFQNVSWHHLMDLAHDVDCDVLVCGDDSDACAEVCTLIGEIGMRGLHAGPLANSAAAEALTSLLISINRRYKSECGSGIRITGI